MKWEFPVESRVSTKREETSFELVRSTITFAAELKRLSERPGGTIAGHRRGNISKATYSEVVVVQTRALVYREDRTSFKRVTKRKNLLKVSLLKRRMGSSSRDVSFLEAIQ